MAMMQADIGIKKLKEHSRLPDRQHPGDAGYDLYSAEQKVIKPNETRLVGTGIAMNIPRGLRGDIKPRSGLALDKGIDKRAGLIDSNYHGEIGVLLRNEGDEPFIIARGYRIAQITFTETVKASFEQVENLGSSERGTAGFGSTGITDGS